VTDINRDNTRFPGNLPTDEPRIILQNRASYTRGSSRCWLALVKPVVDVDGMMYPCCGAQYAVRGGDNRLPSRLCMGNIDNFISEYLGPQKPFDGSICDKCYYSEYNDVLGKIKEMQHLEHVEFV